LASPFVDIGTARFELTTSSTPRKHATRLRYAPASIRDYLYGKIMSNWSVLSYVLFRFFGLLCL
jgi:hypothetical protein